jgi:DNA-binding transcriptional ArsR family regulator
MAVTKALADDSRVRIMMALMHGELCVCQITGLLKLAPSTVSKHLSVLHGAGLVETRKDSRWVYYRIAGKGAPREVKSAVRWLRASLKDNPIIAEDSKALARICRTPPEELCRT